MFLSQRYHRLFITASLIFMVSLIIAIFTHEFLWFIIPFVWILLPLVFTYAVSFTEQLFWLMLIVLPLSTELNITDSLGLDFPDEILLMLLTGIFFIQWIYKPEIFPVSILRKPLFLILVLHLFWLLVCCFFSVDPVLSVKFFLAKIWYVVPFVLLPQIILRFQNDFKKLALCLLLPMLFVVLQALLRHSFYDFSFELLIYYKCKKIFLDFYLFFIFYL